MRMTLTGIFILRSTNLYNIVYNSNILTLKSTLTCEIMGLVNYQTKFELHFQIWKH